MYSPSLIHGAWSCDPLGTRYRRPQNLRMDTSRDELVPLLSSNKVTLQRAELRIGGIRAILHTQYTNESTLSV
jgi:hypothetical protein